ncbi:MAG TPA: PDZ domain-containing protein [Blastocatellia bacterium]|jgi:membrane-associated protease RseP (regulator of RpoE activity)
MFRRLALIISIVAALGTAVSLADNPGQKDKPKEPKEKDQQKEKGKTTAEASPGWFAFDFGGEGGYLGVYLEEVTPERSKELGLREERGAIVMKVVAGSPAEKSGLKENDVIVSFNGRRVDSVRELQRLLNETPPDRSVQIEVVRGGSHQTVAATLAKHSLHGYNLLGPNFDENMMKHNEEAMKQAEESIKRSQEAWEKSQEKFKIAPNFGEFNFVGPGQLALLGGSRLGISAQSLTGQLGEFFGVKDGKGVLVASVAENSAAAKAGLKAGDVIIAVDDQKVDNVGSLTRALSSKKEGTVAVKIVRNRSEQTVNVTIEKSATLIRPRHVVARPARPV